MILDTGVYAYQDTLREEVSRTASYGLDNMIAKKN